MAQLATTFPRTASANRITQALIESAWPMAKACNAKAIFMARSNEGLVYPNHRQAFPSTDRQHVHALDGVAVCGSGSV